LIKREARILGLSAHPRKLKRIPIVGIIFRGNLWLDGMLACRIEPNRPEYPSELVRAITQSKQYSQIRAVILSRETLTSSIGISISDFSRLINIPVITILGRRSDKGRLRQDRLRLTKPKAGHFRIRIAGKFVSIDTTGVSGLEAQEILEVACAKGQWIPEALRAAHTIAKNLAQNNLLQGSK
jgi:endonuclease V-like protein UPF0215 family